jgi:isopentenyldiphosphate isomerase
MKKDLYPGFWAVGAAGHVHWGDSYRDTAERELKEELGLTGQLFYVTTLMVKAEQESEMVQIFILKQNEIPQEYDRDEVDEVQFVPMNSLQQFVNEHIFPPADKEVLKLLMYIR